jgi:hypothetical protein
MKDFRRFAYPCVVSVALGWAGVALPAAAETSSPAPLRISPSQYRQTIADVFGLSIAINGRFEPEIRDDGLLAIGESRASFSDAGVERYDELARGVAAQVVDQRHRDVLLPCKPQSAADADAACARAFFTASGRLLFRRPLAQDEIQGFVDVADKAAASKHDFYAGISAGLAVMLVSPEFLFRFRDTEPDPTQPGRERLTGYAKATVLSFFLWNSSPDAALLKAAEKGELHTKEGLRRQVDRMVSSPALKGGVRAFFSDMLGFDQFEILSKDPKFFPDFTLKVKADAEEQTLLTIVDHLITRQGDYRDLLTTPHTFLTRSLASLYGVPLMDTADNGQPMHWQPYTYADGDPRAGLLAQASFVALFSPAGRTSPTGRGKALREHLLCQVVPPPPANVDFSLVQNASNPVYKTARDRLTAHRSNPVCAGCHRITDPIGLALENFDSSGGYRTTENGVPIDTSGDLNGIKFSGPVGLAKALHDDPAVTSCVANKAYAFAAGHLPASNDPEWTAIQKKFADSHYNFIELVRQIAMSDLLYSVPAPQTAAAGSN